MTGIVTQGTVSRRAALRAGVASVAATLGAAAIAPRLLAQEATPVADQDRVLAGAQDGLSREVVEAFKGLPGQQALKLWAPAHAGSSEWSAALNPGSQLFIGSVFKGLVLAECLRLEEGGAQPSGRDLPRRPARRLPGPAADARRGRLLADLPRLQPAEPDRSGDVAHDAGGDLQYSPTADASRPNLNDEITMASTPDDLVSFYARALQGEFFRHAETLAVFRAILGSGDAVALSMPLGVSGFGKGGSIEFGGATPWPSPAACTCPIGGSTSPW